MTINYRILGQATSSNLYTDTYSVPENKKALLKTITLCNTSSSPANINLAVVDNYSYVSIPRYMLVAANKYITSTDAITWSSAESIPSGITVNDKVTYFNNKYYYPSYNSSTNAYDIKESSDWYTWTVSTSTNISTINTLKSVNQKLFALPGYGSVNNSISYSTNGVTWITSTVDTLSDPVLSVEYAFTDIVYQNNKYVLSQAGLSGNTTKKVYVYDSTDLVTWTRNTVTEQYNVSGFSNIFYKDSQWNTSVMDLTAKVNPYNGNVFPIYKIASSTDLITWTVSTGEMISPKTTLFDNNIFSWTGDITFYSGGGTGISTYFSKSTDGTTWTRYTTEIVVSDNSFISIINNQMHVLGSSWYDNQPSYFIFSDASNYSAVSYNTGNFIPNYGTTYSINYPLPNLIENPTFTADKYIVKNYYIEPGQTVILKNALTLEENKKIIASSDSSISINLFGAEQDV